jgi:hypothetical protein
VTVSYSDVLGGWPDPGLTNIDADPAFDDPQFFLRLLPSSPCRDAGTNLFVAGIVDDFEGTTRPQGPAYDMGAFEYADAVVCADADSDGWTDCDGDCDDSDPDVNPGMNEKGQRKNDGKDNDCNGVIDG